MRYSSGTTDGCVAQTSLKHSTGASCRAVPLKCWVRRRIQCFAFRRAKRFNRFTTAVGAVVFFFFAFFVCCSSNLRARGKACSVHAVHRRSWRSTTFKALACCRCFAVVPASFPRTTANHKARHIAKPWVSSPTAHVSGDVCVERERATR